MKKVYTVLSFLFLCVLSIHAQRLGSMQHVVDPKGEVTMAGKTKGYITKEELLNSGGLQLRKQFSPTYNIFKFRMVIVYKEKSRRREFDNITGNELTPEMSDAIKEAKDGDKIYFERIVCTDPKDSLYESDPVAFKLKVLPPPDSTQAKTVPNEAANRNTGQSH